MHDAATIERIQRMYIRLGPEFDERSRRVWAAAEALELGWGGTSVVAVATGLSRTTIRAGIVELQQPTEDSSRVRRPGGGRKPLTADDPELRAAAWSRLWSQPNAANRNRPALDDSQCPGDYLFLHVRWAPPRLCLDPVTSGPLQPAPC